MNKNVNKTMNSFGLKEVHAWFKKKLNSLKCGIIGKTDQSYGNKKNTVWKNFLKDIFKADKQGIL